MRSYLRTYGEQRSSGPNPRLQRRIETSPVVPASSQILAPPGAQALLRLQQSYGNAYVRQLIQTRLRPNAPSAPLRHPTTAPFKIDAVMTGADSMAAVIEKMAGSTGAASLGNTIPGIAPLSAGVKTTGEAETVLSEQQRAPGKNEPPPSADKSPAKGATGKEIPRAPASPAQDPAFQKAKTQVRGEAKRQKTHPLPFKKRQEAMDASAMEPVEQEDQSSKVKNADEMKRVGEEQQNKGKQFSADQFKKDFEALVNKQNPPRDADEVKAFSQNPPIETFPKDFSDGVAKKQGEVTEPLKQQTTKKPTPDKAKEAVNVPAPVQPRAPAPVDPKLAVPKARTDQEISLQHEGDRIDDAMRDNDLSDDQLAESREPQFLETLKVKQEAKKKVAEAPEEYRKREDQILQGAEKPATKLLSSDLATLGKIHHKIGGRVFKGQTDTETNTEKRQREIKKKIDDIYNGTVNAVTGILEGMTTQVKLDFAEGLKQQTTNFNDNVRKRVSDYYGDWRIDDELFGPDDVIVESDGSTRSMTLDEKFGLTKTPRINPDVYKIFRDEKNKFIAAMSVVLDNIAKKVEAGLTLAQTQIQLGKTAIDIFKSTLKGDELEFAEQLESEVKIKFENLEGSINDTRDDLLQTLADQYRDNVAQLEKTFNEINDELKKSWIDRAIEFVETVGKTIFQLADLLLTILKRMAHLIWSIIKHPIRFFETLVSGLIKGIGTFIDNIGDYLQEAFWNWITGATSVTSIRLSSASGIEGLFDLVVQVLRLGRADLRLIVEGVLGKPFMEMIDQGVAAGEKFLEPVILLLTKGPLALWERIRDTLGTVIQSAFDRIKESVFFTFIEKALKWVAGFFIPGGGFVKVVKAIFSAFQFVVENLDNIRQFFEAVFDSMEAAVEGHTEGVANKIVTGLKTGVVLALDFLAKQLGLSKIVDTVQKTIQSLRRPIVGAIKWVLGKVKPFLTKLKMKGKKLLDKTRRGRKRRDEEMVADSVPVTDVRRQALILLQRELKEDHTRAEAEKIVSNIGRQLRRSGLKRLYIEPPDKSGLSRIMAEASPLLPLAGLIASAESPKARRSVKLGVRITLVEPVSVSEGHFAPVNESSTVKTGGQVITGEKTQTVELVTWNTSNINTPGNSSHAEHQFVAWMNGQSNDFLRRITTIELNLKPLSPCSNCSDDLRKMLKKIATVRDEPFGKGDARLYWLKLYKGLPRTNGIARTTSQNVYELNKAGWKIYAPVNESPSDETIYRDLPETRVHLLTLPKGGLRLTG